MFETFMMRIDSYQAFLIHEGLKALRRTEAGARAAPELKTLINKQEKE